jgi:hypothetical protein
MMASERWRDSAASARPRLRSANEMTALPPQPRRWRPESGVSIVGRPVGRTVGGRVASSSSVWP